MFKKLLLITILFLALIKAHAQESFIIYNNDTEKLLFKGVNTSDDCLKLVLAADMNEADMRKYYSNLANDAKQISAELDKIAQPEKKIEKLKGILHGSYLKNYRPVATFNDLFNNGSYNADQAVILYTWFLDNLHIPYETREEPNKFYVLVYPLTSKIVMDGLDKSFTGVSDDAKTNYVLDLIKLKYLDDEYVRQVGALQAFDNFFFKKGNLGPKTLAGYLYFDRAQINLQLNKIGYAYSDAIKSAILAGEKKCEVLQKGILLQLLPTLKLRDVRDWEAAVYAFNNVSVTDDQKKYLNYQFQETTQELVWKQGKIDVEEQIHSYINANLKDTTLRNSIDDGYYTETAKYYYTTNKYPEALQSLGKLLAKNPNNVPAKQGILEILLRKELTPNTGTVHNIALLDQAVKDFPVLENEPAIQRQYIYNYSFLSGNAFSRGDKENGEKYQKLMCAKILTLKSDTPIDIEYAGEAFVKASEYYLAKQGKPKALQVLNDGLKYVPNSIYITQRIKFVKAGNPTVQSHSSAFDKLKIFNQ